MVPRSFAHGYCTVTKDTELYKLDSRYAPETEGGGLWCDSVLGIDQPVSPAEAVLSDRDKALPVLADLAPMRF